MVKKGGDIRKKLEHRRERANKERGGRCPVAKINPSEIEACP